MSLDSTETMLRRELAQLASTVEESLDMFARMRTANARRGSSARMTAPVLAVVAMLCLGVVMGGLRHSLSAA